VHGAGLQVVRHGGSVGKSQKERDMTKLDKPIRRELTIKDIAYTLVIDPDGLKLTEKGRRKGIELKWTDVVSGDAGMASALQASVDA
jgi:hypothetical protein